MQGALVFWLFVKDSRIDFDKIRRLIHPKPEFRNLKGLTYFPIGIWVWHVERYVIEVWCLKPC